MKQLKVNVKFGGKSFITAEYTDILSNNGDYE